LKHVLQLVASRSVSYFRNSRVLEWRAYIGIAMFGFVSNLGFTTASILLESFKFALTIAFYLAFSFPVNNSFDSESDVLRKERA